jgi:polar amino acid transport system ATP-binding protein
MTNEQPIVRIEDLYKAFGEIEVLKGVSLTVQSREVVVIVGSGAAKRHAALSIS